MTKYLKENLANLITLFGLVGAIWLLVIMINNSEQLWLVLVLAIAIGLTDLFDGLIARHLKIESKFGSALDRLRDKIFICPILIILIWRHHESSLTVAIVLSLVLIETLLLIAWFIGLFKKLNVSSNRYGRIKMFIEFFIVVFWLLFLIVKKHSDSYLLRFFVYLINACLLIATYFAIRSLEQYYRRYSGETNNPKK